MSARAEAAMSLEDGAAMILKAHTYDDGGPHENVDPIQIAQVMATLALGQRVADLTDKLDSLLPMAGRGV